MIPPPLYVALGFEFGVAFCSAVAALYGRVHGCDDVAVDCLGLAIYTTALALCHSLVVLAPRPSWQKTPLGRRS